jgi:predicted aspartyl protease
MVKVEKIVRVIKEDKLLEVLALFDTGSRRSYLSRNLAEKIGYEILREPKMIPLAVEGRYAELVGWAVIELEVEGYRLPEREVLVVIDGLLADAVIGLNIMESYGIYIENDEIRFKNIPPTSMII